MQPYPTLLPAMLFAQTLLAIETTATDYYFTSHGAFNNSCRVTECRTCNIGEYRVGCSNASSGICTNCTRIPNATFITHGWFNNSCGFLCSEGYAFGPGRSCFKVSTQYTINFLASVTLINNTNQSFNLTLYINTVAILAGCGQCGNADTNPVRCGGCKLYYNVITSIPVVYRRLLSSGSVVDVNTSIIIMDDKILAKSAEFNINSSMLNSRLVKANFGIITVGKAPTLTTLTILPQLLSTTPDTGKGTSSTTPKPLPPATTPASGNSNTGKGTSSTTPKPLPPATTPVSGNSNTGDSNIGVVIGGAVGGVAVVVCIIVLVLFYTRNGAKPTPSTLTPRTSSSMFAYKQAGSTKLASKLVYVRKYQIQ